MEERLLPSPVIQASSVVTFQDRPRNEDRVAGQVNPVRRALPGFLEEAKIRNAPYDQWQAHGRHAERRHDLPFEDQAFRAVIMGFPLEPSGNDCRQQRGGSSNERDIRGEFKAGGCHEKVEDLKAEGSAE